MRPRPLVLGVVLVLGAALPTGCDLFEDEPTEERETETFQIEPAWDRIRASGECWYFRGDEGHLWRYEDLRPTYHSVGWGGTTNIVETWTYDELGRLIRFERAPGEKSEVALDDDRIETWTWDERDNPVRYTRDLFRNGRDDQVWTWTWDDQNRLIRTEAQTDFDPAIDYAETISYPSPTLERTEFDLDGNGTTDVTWERNFGADGEVADATLQGIVDGQAHYRYEQRIHDEPLDLRYAEWANSLGSVFTTLRVPVGVSETLVELDPTLDPELADASPELVVSPEVEVLGGLQERCEFDRARGLPLLYAADERVEFPEVEPLQVPGFASSAAWDARANVIASAVRRGLEYNGEFEAFFCGGHSDPTPAFPQPIEFSTESWAIDPLCEPEFRGCRAIAGREVRCFP